MAAHPRRDHLRGRHALALADDPDVLVDVVGERDGAPQRDPLRRVAADDGILHVEVEVAHRRQHLPLQLHAGVGVLRQQPVAGIEHLRHQVDRDREVVEVVLRKSEQPRARFVDDAHLDPANERQLPPDELCRPLPVGGIGRRRIAQFAKARIGVEHDLLPAPPLAEPIGAGADRIGHRPARRVAVGLDHLARDGAGCRGRQVGDEFVVGKRELEAQRVAIDRLQPGDRRVVVEAPGLARPGDDRVGADEAAVDHLQRIRPHPRIEDALDRVDVIGGDEFAPLTLERRVVGEVDSRPDADRPPPAVGGDLGQRLRRVGHQLVRAGQVVVGVERVEDRPVDVVGERIAGGLRVEPGLGDGERHAQHLAGVGLRPRRGPGSRQPRGGQREGRGDEPPPCRPPAARPAPPRVTAASRCRRRALPARCSGRSAPRRCRCGRPGTW